MASIFDNARNIVKDIQSRVRNNLQVRPNTLTYNALQPAARAQQFIQSPQSYALPQASKNPMLPTPKVGSTSYNILNAAAKVQPVAQAVRDFANVPFAFAANSGSDLGKIAVGSFKGDPGLLAYGNLKSPATKLGYNAVGAFSPSRKQAYGIDTSPQQFLGNAAETIMAPLSIYGSGKVLGIGKQAATQVGKQGFVQTINSQAISGGKLLGSYGILSGLAAGKNGSLPDQLKEGLKQGAMGGIAGLATGGLIGAGGATFGAVRKAITDTLVQKHGFNAKQARDALGRFAKYEAKRVAKGKPPTPGEPIWVGDIRESVGLPRNGNYELPQPGLSVKYTNNPINQPAGEIKTQVEAPKTKLAELKKLQEVQNKPETQLNNPVPVSSRDILPQPTALAMDNEVAKIQAQIQNQVAGRRIQAEVVKSIRSQFGPQDIQNINRLKAMARGREFQAGDIETLRKKNGDLVESVLSAVKERSPQITDEAQALDYALNFPTASQQKVLISPETGRLKQQEKQLKSIAESGVIPGGEGAVSVFPTTKTLQKQINARDRLAAKTQEKIAQKEYDEWQEVLLDQEGVKTTKAVIDDIIQLVKTSTAKAEHARFETSAKTGETLVNKANNALERDILDRAATWKDKMRLSYTRERFDRNIEDIAGKDASAIIKRYFAPVQQAEANRTRWLNKERDEIKSLDIKGGSGESKALQQFGERKMTLDQLKQQLPKTWNKVVTAEKMLRGKYDQYLTDINKVLAKNGYDPIPKREDYFLHFTEINNVLENFGIPVRDNTLPTDLAGLTADFKPGKNFFTSALPRLGDKTDFDAIQGIDRYLEGASKQIFHTDNIQNLRLFEKGLRNRFAGTTHLSNFTADLGEYINNLAGKKPMMDRGVEAFVGRNVYGAADRLQKQVGSNMVGANIASALTNFIPLTQSIATTSKPAVVKGLLGAAMSPFKNDGFVQRSDFLTSRFGSDRLYMNAWDNVATKSFWIMKTVDRFVSESITRGKYHEGLSKGLNPQEALRAADNYASRVMGDRSLGSMPNLFNSRTAGFLTQFQLEVNNQVSFLLKDIPRMNNGNKKAIASSLGQVALYSYLYNNMYESLVGRRPAVDPVGIAQQAYGDYTNPDMKKEQATKNLVVNVGNQLPFTSILTGGRIPVGSVIPNPMAALTGESSWTKELTKPLTILPPAGGSQIKKSVEGIGAFIKGTSTTPAGKERYEIPQTAGNAVKTGLFGQYSTPEARQYFREGGSPPSASKMLYNQFKSLKNTQEKAALWDKMVSEGKITKDNRADVLKHFEDEKLGITGKEREIRSMGVSDGARAQSIVKEFDKLKTPQEKAALWDKYVQAKIITPEVAKQMKLLLQK